MPKKTYTGPAFYLDRPQTLAEIEAEFDEDPFVCDDIGVVTDIEDPNLLERLREEREQARKAWLSGADNFTTLKDSNEKQVFMKAHKRYLEALGLRPCAYRDCMQYIKSENPRKLYCDDWCRRQEQRKRDYDKNPQAQMNANERYYKSM